jgi:hypothetical protein
MNRNTDLIRLLWSRRFIAIATFLQTFDPVGVISLFEPGILETEIQKQLNSLKYE